MFWQLGSNHLQSQSELYHINWWYYTLVVVSWWPNFYTINRCDTPHFDSEDDYSIGCQNFSQCQEQSSQIMLNLIMKWLLGSNRSQFNILTVIITNITKILSSDWLSIALISASIRYCSRTVCHCYKTKQLFEKFFNSITNTISELELTQVTGIP